MKRLRWLITVPLALIFIVFAVNNRHLIDVRLWPLELIVRWPLFVVVYIGVIAGFFAGAVIAWVSAVQRQRRTSQRRSEKAAQTDETGRRKDQSVVVESAGTTPPALID